MKKVGFAFLAIGFSLATVLTLPQGAFALTKAQKAAIDEIKDQKKEALDVLKEELKDCRFALDPPACRKDIKDQMKDVKDLAKDLIKDIKNSPSV